MPSAFVRSFGSVNSSAIMPSDAGAASASATPWPNRPATIIAWETAAPQTAEATAKRTTPVSSRRRRPKYVGEPPAEDQQAAGCQHVRVDDPGQAGRGEAEAVLDRGAAPRSRW